MLESELEDEKNSECLNILNQLKDFAHTFIEGFFSYSNIDRRKFKTAKKYVAFYGIILPKKNKKKQMTYDDFTNYWHEIVSFLKHIEKKVDAELDIFQKTEDEKKDKTNAVCLVIITNAFDELAKLKLDVFSYDYVDPNRDFFKELENNKSALLIGLKQSIEDILI